MELNTLPPAATPWLARKMRWLAAAAVSSSFGAIPVVQEWYVPQPEDQIRADYLVLAPNTNTTADSVIAVTVAIAGTKIVYDQWEDGYEVDISNPTQAATTQIWGDGNDANGKPPGYTNDPASFAAGALILMRNNVPLPRNAATVLFDGRDRIGSTYGIVMTRAAWFTKPGPLLANSVEVRAVPDWGTSFVLPVGEDVIFPTPLTSSMLEHCSADIMAAATGTVELLRAAGEEKPIKLTRSSISNIVFMEKLQINAFELNLKIEFHQPAKPFFTFPRSPPHQFPILDYRKR